MDTKDNTQLINIQAGLAAIPEGWNDFSLKITPAMLEGKFPLPQKITVSKLHIEGWKQSNLPSDWKVRKELVITHSPALESLPSGLRLTMLRVQNCIGLVTLPEDLEVSYLSISGCSRLQHWPESAQVRCGWVSARDCVSLVKLPSKLGPLSSLDLAGCAHVSEIPRGVDIRSWLDVAGTAITAKPPYLSDLPLRWRGVQVTERVAFRPEEITAMEALEEPNAELRRVLIEQMGFERFLAEADAKKLDQDQDPGGIRRLFQVELPGDEPLVVVSVSCPSTDRQYLIRVPPTTRTCAQGIAWTAGFDDPALYQPLVET